MCRDGTLDTQSNGGCVDHYEGGQQHITKAHVHPETDGIHVFTAHEITSILLNVLSLLELNNI